MKCDKCNDEAIIEINILSEDGSAKVSLCESCYTKYLEEFKQMNSDQGHGEEEQFKFFQQILSELVSSMLIPNETGEDITETAVEGDNGKSCSSCGTSFAWIIQNGKFGCDHCYEEFRNAIDQILLQTQGANEHKGKVPEMYEGLQAIQKEIREKEDQLKELVYEEKYEEAAAFRDELNNLKEDLVQASDQINEG